MKKLLPAGIYEARKHNLNLLLDGRTQSELQLMTGISQTTISHILQGRNMSSETARKLEDRLGLPSQWMDAYQDKAPPVFHSPHYASHQTAATLLKALTALGAMVEHDPSFSTPYGHLNPDLLVVTYNRRFAIKIKDMQPHGMQLDQLLAMALKAKAIELDLFFVVQCDVRTSAYFNTRNALSGLVASRMALGFTVNEDPLPTIRNLLSAA